MASKCTRGSTIPLVFRQLRGRRFDRTACCSSAAATGLQQRDYSSEAAAGRLQCGEAASVAAAGRLQCGEAASVAAAARLQSLQRGCKCVCSSEAEAEQLQRSCSEAAAARAAAAMLLQCATVRLLQCYCSSETAAVRQQCWRYSSCEAAVARQQRPGSNEAAAVIDAAAARLLQRLCRLVLRRGSSGCGRARRARRPRFPPFDGNFCARNV